MRVHEGCLQVPMPHLAALEWRRRRPIGQRERQRQRDRQWLQADAIRRASACSRPSDAMIPLHAADSLIQSNCVLHRVACVCVCVDVWAAGVEPHPEPAASRAADGCGALDGGGHVCFVRHSSISTRIMAAECTSEWRMKRMERISPRDDRDGTSPRHGAFGRARCALSAYPALPPPYNSMHCCNCHGHLTLSCHACHGNLTLVRLETCLFIFSL